MKKIFVLLLVVLLVTNVLAPLSYAQEASSAAQIASNPTPTPDPTVSLDPTQLASGTAGLTIDSQKTNPFSDTTPQVSDTKSSSSTPLDLSSSQGLNSAQIRGVTKLRTMLKKLWSATEQVTVVVENAKADELTTSVTDSGGHVVSIAPELTTVGGVTTIKLPPPHAFRPGLFKVKVTDTSGHTLTQDFTWGVLALNTDKAVYAPNETAAIAMAVLDEKGSVTCDATVTLTITTPQQEKKVLSTTDSSIVVHTDVCSKHDVTDIPDYSASYVTSEVGDYGLELTAETKNGTYTITDSFSVKQNSLFSVVRTSATRIYPYNQYPMTMQVTAGKDFSGIISETVPASFAISPLAGSPSFLTGAVLGESTSADVPELQLPFHGKHAVSQGFGATLTDPQEKSLYAKFGLAGHDGIDFDMPIGTPVYAADSGKVVLAGDGAYGTTLVIQHSWGKTYYGHLSEIQVKVGDEVSQGQQVALSGNTGLSTDPHLHFSLKLNSANMDNGYFGKINPAAYLPLDSLTDKKTDVLGAAISNDQGLKKVSWKVTMKKGETTTLGYMYKAPEVSPQFYTVGPLTFTSLQGQTTYTEEREWQIAADAVDGQMTLYFHRESSDLNSTYNQLSLTPPEPATDTASGTTSTTNVNAAPPTALCESSGNTGNTFNKVSAASATNGTNERCLASFISMPVGTASNGNAFAITLGDSSAIAGNIWVVNSSATTTTTNTTIYLYKYDGSTLTRFKTLQTTSSPGTTVTQVTYAAAAPDVTVSFASTDRIVAIVSRTVTNRVASSSISVLFDSTARAAASLTLKYTPLTDNHPTLGGTKDDDFTTAAATTNCATAGTTYNTKWTCVTNSSSSTTLGTFSADSSSSTNTSNWLILTSKASTTLGTNFGTPNAFPGNTYIYQTGIPTTDVGVSMTTAVNSTTNSTAGTSPFYHGGLFIRNATTYIILTVGFDGTNQGVWINNNGSLTNSTALSTSSLVWLRWTNTGTGFQAYYSTDGSTFTALGSAIALTTDNTTNTKFGLTAYTGSVSTQYGAAFEYFNYDTVGFNESASRISKNIDSAEPNAVVEAPGTLNQATHVVALDSTNGYIYSAGDDEVPGNYEWRLEKRNVSDGSLVTSFGTNGIIQENLSSGVDAPFAIVIDVTNGYMYVGGYDAVNTNLQWRIEKRLLSDGSLVNAFGTSGVVQENPSANDEEITSLAVDPSGGYLYVGGFDRTSGDEWRLEKRNTSDGSLVNAFGTSGVITSDNTGSGGHRLNALSLDTANGVIYSAGYGFNGTSDQWRIEKRNTSDGSVVSGFGSSGILIEDPTAGHDQLYTMDVDLTGGFMYLGGRDDAGSGNYEWRFEKRLLSTGALVSGFGTSGIKQEDPSANEDEIWQLKVDTTNNVFYTVGYDKISSNVDAAWRVEKRSTTDGSVVSAFGTSGIISGNFTTAQDDIARNVAVDPTSGYLYIVGYDSLPGTYTEIRIEKRNTSDGSLAWGAFSAAQDTGVLLAARQAFRLQQLVQIINSPLPVSGITFSLQYVDKGTGTCALPSGGTPSSYTNVTTGTLIAFNNNTTPADGDTLYTSTGVTNGADTIRPQTYEELNDFTNSSSSVAAGEDARWDFALINNGGVVGTTYCFRVVQSSGTVLDTYTTYAQVTIGPSLDLMMRHGRWFQNGAIQPFTL